MRYEREVKKYQITFEITDWKTEKREDSLYFILYLHYLKRINFRVY